MWDPTPQNQRLYRIRWLTLGTSPRRSPRPHRSIVHLVLAAGMVSFIGLLWSFFRQTLPDGGVAFGNERQDTSSPEAIVAQCEVFMRKNLLTGTAHGHDYSFNQPSSYKYSPSQWLWGKTSSAISRQAIVYKQTPFLRSTEY